ncbi:MerR-like DNA binding protein [Motilibacter peucedani]|uniref:MerR-like DNA binding protein n=1 Tax=Motilibacter peucedani TaxID=598650 RepID=A0A420XMR2_9ACTN|nr:MerR family transcriptional regulator [Motilibacter peucedani]RKS72552.1 MerR-like DNA binding protein [Motilibacter peucedani]
MELATVQEAAATTGWSPRMLRYVEQRGLVVPRRSSAGYRLYGPAELDRLRTLRTLLDETGLELSDVAVALRLRRERALHEAVDGWLDGVPPAPPAAGAAGSADALDALRWDQERHLRLLRSGQHSRNNVKEAQ